MSLAFDNKTRLNDFVSVKVYGAKGDGTTDDTAAIKAAILAASRVHFPAGTYRHDGTITVPSNRVLFGDGDSTLLKVLASADDDAWGLKVISAENVTIRDMKLDGQNTRLFTVKAGTVSVTAGSTSLSGTSTAFTTDLTVGSTVVAGEHMLGTVESITSDVLAVLDIAPAVSFSGSTYSSHDFAFTGGPYGSGIIVQDSSRVLIENVSSIDWMKHCFDVTADSYTTGDPTEWVTDGRSSYVVIRNCYGSGAGDDVFTTHQSDYILIEGCHAEDPSGLYVANNTNCFEVDDGSRYVTVRDVFAKGGACGIQVKGHSDSAAAQNVLIDGAHIDGCNYGVDCYNTGFYGDGFGGYSTTAYGLQIKNVYITNPTEAHVTGEEAPFALRVRSYSDVSIENIHVSGGTVDYDGGVVGIRAGARNVSAKRIYFSNISLLRGLRVTSPANNVLLEDIFASGVTGTGVSPTLIYFSINDDVNIRNVRLQDCTNLDPIQDSGKSLAATTRNSAIETYQFEATSTGSSPVSPRVVTSYGWVEGSQNLGEGEGMAHDFTAQLVSDTSPCTVARIRSYKANDSETDRGHNLEFGVSTDNGSTLTYLLKLMANGAGTLVLGDFSNDSAASAGGVPVGGLYRTGTTVKVRAS